MASSSDGVSGTLLPNRERDKAPSPGGHAAKRRRCHHASARVGALLNTWQLDDKLWFASLLALGLLGFGVVAMIAYVVAAPDGTKQSVARPSLPEVART